MKAQHTPGPWRVEKTGPALLVWSDKPGLCASVNPPGSKADKTDIANARLIAAAPDLLEACDLVQRAHVGDGVTMAEAVDACLLAIDKAHGIKST